MPLASVNDAMTLGIVNDRSAHVDADFLMPSLDAFRNRTSCEMEEGEGHDERDLSALHSQAGLDGLL